MERYDKARRVFKEALKYTPDDYDLHFELAQIEFSTHHPRMGRRHVEQALEVGHNESEAYEQAFVCWVFEDNLKEAKNVLARGQAGTQLTADFYINTGLSCFKQAGPPPDSLKIEDGEPKNPAQPGRNSKTNPISSLGRELLEQAITIGPKTKVLAQIAMGLSLSQPQLGLQYARRLIEYAPDDATAQLALGVSLGMNQQIKEGKATLRQAARTARKQGLPDVAKMAEEFRYTFSPSLLSTIFRVISSPDDFDFD